MSIAIETSQVVYTGNGATTAFPTVFKFQQNSHVVVELKPNGSSVYATKTLNTDYTLAGAGVDAGGTVTMNVAPAAGDTLRITRTLQIIQQTSFRTQGNFLPAVHEDQFDYVTEWGQMLLRRVAALEAGTVGSSYTATRVTDTFTMGEPPEGAPFPRVINAGVVPTTVVIGRIENLTTPAEVQYAQGFAWRPAGGNNFQVDFIEGLTPGQQYRITYEVRT